VYLKLILRSWQLRPQVHHYDSEIKVLEIRVHSPL